MGSEPLIDIALLSHSFDRTAPMLTNINFTLQKGEMVFISGRSGCGKSTFLRILNRLIEPRSGTLRMNGRPYDSYDVRLLRRKIQLVPQIPVLFDMSVEENLRMAKKEADEGKIKHLLAEFNLPSGILGHNAKKLSVGQMQRLCVIRSLLLEPDALLMDEPTAALDPENRAIFSAAFERVRTETGPGVVWVTHDVERSLRAEGRHLVLDDGRLNGG